jgi:hypothetical protein
MKNKHTLANKELQKLNKQYPSIPTPGSTEPNEASQILKEKEPTKNPLLPEDMLPGKSGKTFKIKLDRDNFNEGDKLNTVSNEYQVESKVYTKWWQKLLNKITFGLYKPTTFWYKIKAVKK